MTHLFLLLLRIGIDTCKASDKECEALLLLSMAQWRKLMLLAEKQGVAAIAFDGVQRLFEVYQKGLIAAKDTPTEWMQWVFECTSLMTQYEQMSRQQKEVISEIADILDKDGIKMMVFKGQVNALFYPIPMHRAAGDIDCYLFGDTNKGDILLAGKGASIENNWYRHSKISFHGETIENHRVMSHTRGSKKKKMMEEELRSMVKISELKTIKGCGNALMPSVLFNACFLTYHGMHHFLSEGLRLKQILDWALFLKVYQKEVDWGAYNGFCKRYKLDRFAGVMNYIAVHYLGIVVQEDCIVQDGKYAEKIMQSTLRDDDYLFSSGKSDWNVRWLLVKNMLGRDRWKYKCIAQNSVLKHLWQNTTGFLFEKD